MYDSSIAAIRFTAPLAQQGGLKAPGTLELLKKKTVIINYYVCTMHHYKSRQKQTTNKATKLEHWNQQTNTVDKQRMKNAMDKKTGVAHMQCTIHHNVFKCCSVPTSKDVLVEFTAQQGGLKAPRAGITQLPSTAGNFETLLKKKSSK